jgi:hypothetical protein
MDTTRECTMTEQEQPTFLPATQNNGSAYLEKYVFWMHRRLAVEPSLQGHLLEHLIR